jgi:hypothetical protein
MENNMNNLYKNTDGIIYGFGAWQTVPEGMTKLTQKEYDAHVNPKPTPEQALAEKMTEAKQYLDSTDHKFYGDYELKEGEDLTPIRLARSEARAFIRDNQ